MKMGRIHLTESSYSLIPEGIHTFRIFGVEYNEKFGKMIVHMINAQGQTHKERFQLLGANGQPNEGAYGAFSFFAKTAMNDYSLEDIDTDDLVNHYITCEVVHTHLPSTKKPGEKVTFVNLGREKQPADGFGTPATKDAMTRTLKPNTATVEAEPEGEVDLDALLGE